MAKRDRYAEMKATRSRIAMERAERLLELADKMFKKRPEFAHRYAKLTWMLKTRYTLRFPALMNRKICRKCQAYLVPGATCRVRTVPKRPPHVVITCLRCGYHRRIPYKSRKSGAPAPKRSINNVCRKS